MNSETWSSAVIFGNVTTNSSGSLPAALRNRSSVRSARGLDSGANDLTRSPMNGGSVPSSNPLLS